MSENSLIAAQDPKPNFKVEITAEGLAVKQNLLEQTGLIISVEDEEESKLAVGVIADAKKFLSDIEKTRKKLKEPILEAGKAIDSAAKGAVSGLEAEISRVEKMVSAYNVEQAKKAAEEVRRAEEQRRRDEEEAQRLADEAQRLMDKGGKKAVEKASQLLEKAGEIATKVESAPVAQYHSVAGASLRNSVDIEVIDPAALYRKYPHLVELVVKKAELRALVEALGDNVSIDGVKVTRGLAVSVRKAK